MSKRIWGVNASPLIALASIGQASLLEHLCQTLVIPEAVAVEVCAGSPQDAARRWLESRGTKYIQPVTNLDPVILAWDLGAGESAVLAWAREQPGREAIVDDRAARNCAQSLGIPIRGTIGIVALAKREGLIPLAQPVLQQLASAGLRVTPEIIERALRLAGEK